MHIDNPGEDISRRARPRVDIHFQVDVAELPEQAPSPNPPPCGRVVVSLLQTKLQGYPFHDPCKDFPCSTRPGSDGVRSMAVDVSLFHDSLYLFAVVPVLATQDKNATKPELKLDRF